jgi:hypothetical protein
MTTITASEGINQSRRNLYSPASLGALNRLVAGAEDTSIRPFRVDIPESALTDLRRRLAEARLPEQETVADYSQGVPLKTVQQLLRYWRTDYDWRNVEARLNAVPNFITEIDGLDIHFIHAVQA